MARTIGVDLGTANTYIYRKNRGIVVREPSVIAIDEEKSRVTALGEDAYELLGKALPPVKTYRPVRDGVIAEFDITTALLRGFFEKASGKGAHNRPNVILGVSHGITEVERRALEEAATEAGARSVAIIEATMAAALGAGLPINEPRGSMIVNIGGGTTDVAVMSLGGIVEADSVRVGGDELDEAVLSYLKRKYNLIISETAAEEIKKEFGFMGSFSEDESIPVRTVDGRDAVSGLPLSIELAKNELKESLEEQLAHVVDCIKGVLEKLTPELSADIHDYGITVSGGVALLEGIDEYLSSKLGLDIKIAENPLDCCIEGMGKVIEISPDLVSFN